MIKVSAQRVIQAVKRALVVGVILMVGLIAHRLTSNKTSAYPYPYRTMAISPQQAAQAAEADVLILGDHAAVNLKRFTEDFVGKTAANLKRPLKLYNWGENGETMAQTLAKVRALTKLPTLTIYHGGLEELSSKRFLPRESPTILANIKKSRNDAIFSLVLTFPWLSRLVYDPIEEVTISRHLAPHRDDYTPRQVQKILTLHYTLYRQELRDLFTYYKEKDANIWVIPQAINLRRVPARTCPTADDQQVVANREKIKQLERDRRLKEAKSLAIQVAQTSLTNADDYYQLGTLLMKSGDYEAARRAFYRARMYDCGLRHSTPVHLKILMEEAEKKGYPVIDFNRLVTNQLGRNKLFFDESTPQDLYYHKLIKIMVDQFNKFLRG